MKRQNETTEEIQAKVDEHTQKSTKKLVQQWNRHLLLNKINHEIMVAFHLLYLNSLQSMTLIYHRVVGGGFEGRVTKKDLMSVIENGGTPQLNLTNKFKTQSTSVDESSNQSSEDDSENSTIPVNGVRKAIAQKHG